MNEENIIALETSIAELKESIENTNKILCGIINAIYDFIEDNRQSEEE